MKMIISVFISLCLLVPISHADVRLGNDISTQEMIFLSRRKEKANQALKRVITNNANLGFKDFPTIALVAMGGGLRSATGTLGMLLGLESIGLLEAVSYLFGLSGSTWSIFPWVASGKNVFDYFAYYQNSLSQGIMNAVFKSKFNLLLKLLAASGEYIQSYGDMLSNALMESEDSMYTKMSSLKNNLFAADFPLPVGTATETSNPNRRVVFEFSPFEAGSVALSAFVPIEEFGSVFKEGRILSSGREDERTLGFYLGLFGAAFSFRLSEVVEVLSSNQTLANLANLISTQQLKPAKIPNINFGIKNAPRSELSLLKLSDTGHADAGKERIATNLPILPALRPSRNIDIIIVYDSSADLKNAPALRAALFEAFENNYRLPFIAKEQIEKTESQDVSIFEDSLCPWNGPMIVYIQGRLLKGRAPDVLVDGSFLKNPKKSAKMHNPAAELYPSQKFTYSKEEIQDLANLGIQKIVKHKDTIINAIANRINRTKAGRAACVGSR